MLYAKETPQHLGISIYGDYNDFQQLRESLFDVILEQEYDINYDYDSSQIRVLGLCYDIRHALMGDREYELLENPSDYNHDLPTHHVYLKFNLLWPEAIYISYVLNDFIIMHRVKKNSTEFTTTIAYARLLQSVITSCLEESVSKTAFSKYIKGMKLPYRYFESYITQYLDQLNYEFIDLDGTKRTRKLSSIIEHIYKKNAQYQSIETMITNYANERDISILKVELDLDYKEDVIW